MCLLFSNKYYRLLNSCVILLFLLCFQFGYNQNVSDVSHHQLNDTPIVDYSYVDAVYDEYSDGEAMETNLAPVVVKNSNSSNGSCKVSMRLFDNNLGKF